MCLQGGCIFAGSARRLQKAFNYTFEYTYPSKAKPVFYLPDKANNDYLRKPSLCRTVL
jgi:hypothetical protein